ncbi:MAG: TetR/AcrR family transcriptional regulator [Psychrosphaera sp.]|nr:TetR/AcrR family transcriptional regulator [Psychrosphaera sp.]
MRTRDRIIQASIELFNEHGERQITTNHIAAHLGISPGNLYYHFRNKNDIIQNIFSEYKQQLEKCFVPQEHSHDAISMLRHSLDGIFELMWRFNFFYANLPDILARDEKLQVAYREVQVDQFKRMIASVTELKNNGVLNIEDEDIPDFVNGLKVTVIFWVSYIKTQNPNTKIERSMVYQGVMTVLAMLKPYLNDADKAGFKALKEHYESLAE